MTDEESAIEHWEERSAIMEFDAGQPRPNAETAALRDTRDVLGLEMARKVQRYRERKAMEGQG